MLVKLGIKFGEYLNADDIARELTGSVEWTSRRAQEIVRERRDAALAQGRDHAFETVMSHPSHIDYMLRAASQGFEIRLFFVATEDPVINEGRVANRVMHGGHDVPRDRIATRYARSLGNLPAAIAAADHCLLFDNSRAESPLRHFAEFKRRRFCPNPMMPGTWASVPHPQWYREIIDQIISHLTSLDGSVP